LSEFLGNGVFASDGAVWKHHRKIASNMFSRRLLRHTLAVGYDVGLDMIQRLKTLVRTGQPSDPDATFDGTTTVDVQDLFFRFTIDIFTLVAFGVELRSFQRDDQHPFAKAFDHMQTRIIERVPNPCWRLSRCLGCSAVERDIQRNAAIIDTFANEVIAQKRRAATNGTTTTGSTTTNGTTNGTEELGPDLISRFLNNNAKQLLKDDGTPPMTNTELRDIVLNFMIAGRDTTACALTWCMYVVLCRGLLSGFVVRDVYCHSLGVSLCLLWWLWCFFVLVFLVLSVFSVLSVCLYLSLLVSICLHLSLFKYLFLLASICLHLSPFVSIHSVCLCLSWSASA
jgi:cytochrome P450